MDDQPRQNDRTSTGRFVKGHSVGSGHRWKPGESGNPEGRKSAGASIREWLNTIENYPKNEVEKIAGDESEPVSKRAAARLWLTAIEGHADLADYEAFLAGSKSLKQLRKDGTDTSRLKSAKRAKGKFGDTRSVELRDSGTRELVQLIEQTGGKPKQAIEMDAHVTGGTVVVPLPLEPGKWAEAVKKLQRDGPPSPDDVQSVAKSADDPGDTPRKLSRS